MKMITTVEEIGEDLIINSFVNTFLFFLFFIKLLNNLLKMKKFLPLLLFAFFTTNFFSQDYTEDSYHGEWRYLYSDDYFFFYNSNGEGIENYNAIPDLTIRIEKNEKGIIDVRLDNVIVYRYDDSGDDYNYVDVDIIIDNDDMLSFNGEVRNVNENETRIYLSSPKDGPRFLDLFDDMKKGKNIYVRTTGAKDPIVFKYSLSGFSAGYTKLINGWSDWVDNNKNPFDSKNPFRN